ncbi:MAG: molybdenum cofactor guanylyltransferase MobA [Paracoccus sp. (in: a-proteobacteria)]|nr:molybdenum cofactor guanylyltransferase MobA [Paracoccus sp. (in: a-proteobacteria)]
MTRPPVVILAGGEGRRMGGADKALVPLGDDVLIGHLLNRLRPQAGALAISSNAPPGAFARYGLAVLPDPLPGRPGPLAGILAGMGWAAGMGADYVISAATDTPWPPADLIDRLCAAQSGAGPVLAADHDAGGALRLHPTFGLWPVALRGDLRAALNSGQRRVRQWAADHGASVAVFDGAEPFFNINTPEDLARAGTMIASR